MLELNDLSAEAHMFKTACYVACLLQALFALYVDDHGHNMR